jgi:hypothetical protein
MAHWAKGAQLAQGRKGRQARGGLLPQGQDALQRAVQLHGIDRAEPVAQTLGQVLPGRGHVQSGRIPQQAHQRRAAHAVAQGRSLAAGGDFAINQTRVIRARCTGGEV